MIKTVIFDIDNTLYSFDRAQVIAYPVIEEYAKSKLGIPREEFKNIDRANMEMLKNQVGDRAPIHSRLIRYQNIIEERGLPLYPHARKMHELYWDTLIDNMEASKGAADTLKGLKQKDIRIGIGSDMTSYIQFRKLEKLGLLEYIDFIVCSEEAGEEKPTPEFFNVVARKALCAREECLFVGDSFKKDYMGAIKAGMKGLWYNPKEEKAPVENDENVISIKELSEVFNYLEA